MKDWLVIGRPITKGNIEKILKLNQSLKSMIKGLKFQGSQILKL